MEDRCFFTRGALAFFDSRRDRRLTHSPWARPQPYSTSRPGFQNTHTSPMRFLCFQTHTPTSDIPPNTYYRSLRTSNTHTATIRLHVLILKHLWTHKDNIPAQRRRNQHRGRRAPGEDMDECGRRSGYDPEHAQQYCAMDKP